MAPKKPKAEPITYGELKKQLEDEIQLLQSFVAQVESKDPAATVPPTEIQDLQEKFDDPSPEKFQPMIPRTGRARVSC